MYVMGDDPRRAATADEIATMCDVLRECLDAGAVGLSTSYVDIEDDLRPVPCRFAEHAELEALCGVLGERGRMLQVVHEFFDPGLTVSRIEMLADLSTRFGIPTTLSPLFHTGAAPTATDQVMAAVERVWADGARVWPQVQTRPIDISWTMDQRSIMFLAIPGWWNVLAMDDPAPEAGGARRPDDPPDAASPGWTRPSPRAVRASIPATTSSATSPSTPTATSSAARSATSPPSGARRRPSC